MQHARLRTHTRLPLPLPLLLSTVKLIRTDLTASSLSRLVDLRIPQDVVADEVLVEFVMTALLVLPFILIPMYEQVYA